MDITQSHTMPSHCPACNHDLAITRLQCPACGTEVAGVFTLSRLASLREPHASLIELFLRVEGNVKDMERALGLSYPTVRARLKEAFAAAGLDQPRPTVPPPMPAPPTAAEEAAQAERRKAILDALERREISAAEAAGRIRALQMGE
jgi:hypothetical protein